MSATVEPIEAAIVLAAVVWLALVLALLVRWAAVWPTTTAMPRPGVMRALVAIRLVGYASGVLLALLVLSAGLLQASTPRPSGPSVWREVLQLGWLLIAVSQIGAIAAVEVLTRLAIRLLDRGEG